MTASRRRGLFYAGLAAGVLVALWLLSLGRASRSEGSLDERRERLAQMDPAEREQLAQNYDRFLHLHATERDQLRSLHTDLEADPDGEQLRLVMQNYHEWLDRLSPYQRVKLASLPAEERLKQVDQWMHDRKRFRLSPEDLQVVNSWVDKHREAIPMRGPGGRGGKDRFEVAREALDELRASLSPPARAVLDDAKLPEDKFRLLFSWINQARRGNEPPGGRPGMRWGEIEQRFEAFNQLSEEEKARLRSMPRDQMFGELRRMARERQPQRDEKPAPSSAGTESTPQKTPAPAEEK